MGRNVWKFLRLEDGTYAVYHKGNRLAEGIPEDRGKKCFVSVGDSAVRNAAKSYASSTRPANARWCSEHDCERR